MLSIYLYIIKLSEHVNSRKNMTFAHFIHRHVIDDHKRICVCLPKDTAGSGVKLHNTPYQQQ